MQGIAAPLVVINFSQHLLGKMHENEPEVMEISQIIVSSKESADTKEQKMRARKNLIAILRDRGDNKHNRRVLEKKHGEGYCGKESIRKQRFQIC